MKSNLKIQICAISLCLLSLVHNAVGQQEPPKFVVNAIRAVENMIESEDNASIVRFIEQSMVQDKTRNNEELIDKLIGIRDVLRDLLDDVSVEAAENGFIMNFASQQGARPLRIMMDSESEAIADLQLLDPPETMELTINNFEETFEKLESEGMSGLVYLKKKGEVMFELAFGMANRDLNIPNSLNTVFGVGSRPIDFTIAAINLLDQKGKINIEDKITNYFEDVPEDKKSITLQHLMTGQSGLPDFFDTDADWDPDLQWIDRSTAIERLMSQQLLFEPGTEREHSHGAFGLLTALIEKVTEISYYEFLKLNFFDPADMSRTGEYGTTRNLLVSDFAAGSGPQIIGIPNIPPNWGRTSWLIKGSGGMFSTLGDLLKFYDMMRSGQVLDKEHNHVFNRPVANLDGSDRGFELFSTYLPPDNEVYLFLNEKGDMTKMRQLIRALQRLVKSEE